MDYCGEKKSIEAAAKAPRTNPNVPTSPAWTYYTWYYNPTFNCNTMDIIGYYQQIICDLMETICAKDKEAFLRTLVGSD